MSIGRKKTSTRKSASPNKTAERTSSVETRSEPCDFVNILMKADREWQADIVQTISGLKTLQQCNEFLLKLEVATTDGDVDLFDRGLGLKSAIQGAVLTRIKPLPRKDADGKIVRRSGIQLPMRDGKRMTLEEYVLEKLPFSVSTAYWCRRIYDVFGFEEARRLGYREMLAQLAPSFRKAIDTVPQDMPDDKDAGERSGAKTESDGDGTHPEEDDSDHNKQVKPLPIKEIEKKVESIDALLDRILAMPKCPDRYNNVSRHLKILKKQKEEVEKLAAKMQRVPEALAETKRDIESWFQAGIEASDRKAKQATEADACNDEGGDV